MKSLNNFITESTVGAKCFVLYAAPKEGEKSLDERLFIGVYSSLKALKEDMPAAEEYISNNDKYNNFEVLYYQSTLNTPLIEL